MTTIGALRRQKTKEDGRMIKDKLDYQKIYKMFYEASMKAIEATGDAYKNLSWFMRNKGAK